jgi:hypothetical protein
MFTYSDPSLCPPEPQLYPVVREDGPRCCRGGTTCTPVSPIFGPVPSLTSARTHDGARPNSRKPGRPRPSSPKIAHHHMCPTTAPVTLTAAAWGPPIIRSMPVHYISESKDGGEMISRTNHGIREVLHGDSDDTHERSLATRGGECRRQVK